MQSNESAQRYYSRILSARRVDGPTFAEAAKDLARAQLAVFAA
jgi:hypothetical protein